MVIKPLLLTKFSELHGTAPQFPTAQVHLAPFEMENPGAPSDSAFFETKQRGVSADFFRILHSWELLMV